MGDDDSSISFLRRVQLLSFIVQLSSQYASLAQIDKQGYSPPDHLKSIASVKSYPLLTKSV